MPGAQPEQLPPSDGGRHSELLKQPRNVSIEHRVSLGPIGHWPSSTESVSPGFATHVPPVHELGLVGWPAREQKDDAQSPAIVHGVPAFAPPMQRRPPQMVAPTAVQSAFVEHGVAAALLQVSHTQRSVVKPDCVQSGLDVLSTRLCVPVVSGSVMVASLN